MLALRVTTMTDKSSGNGATARHVVGTTLAFLCILIGTQSAFAQNRLDRGTATFGGSKYVVRAGDQLRVRIWGWPEASDNTEGYFPVEANGVAYLPVIGAMEVAGKTSDQIQDEYRKRFSQEQRNPVVTVAATFAVSIMGEVRNPGVIDVQPGYTLFDGISVTGGFNDQSNRKEVLLVRNGQTTAISGSSAAETAGKLASTPLESGDRVVVQRSGHLAWQSIASVTQTVLALASFIVVLTR